MFLHADRFELTYLVFTRFMLRQLPF